MKNLISVATLLFSFILGSFAQELPIRSPRGGVYQKVGLTTVTVDYSRPSVKGRTIFGDLVQYGLVWRTGANQVTTITSDTEFMVNGQTIPSGTYAIYTIPNEKEWTFILSKNNKAWGTAGYTQDQDVVRVTVPVEKSDFRESFTVELSDVTDKTLNVKILWENTSASLPIEVEYKEVAEVNIEAEIKSIDGLFGTYNRIASYYIENDPQPEKALKYAKMSCELEEKFYNLKTLSLAYAANGDYKNAIKTAEKSLEKAKEANNRDYITMNTQNIEKWKKMK